MGDQAKQASAAAHAWRLETRSGGREGTTILAITVPRCPSWGFRLVSTVTSRVISFLPVIFASFRHPRLYSNPHGSCFKRFGVAMAKVWGGGLGVSRGGGILLEVAGWWLMVGGCKRFPLGGHPERTEVC